MAIRRQAQEHRRGANSHAGLVQQTTTILGNVVNLTRSGMQFHLGSATSPQGMHNVWGEPSVFEISRVEFTYVLANPSSTVYCTAKTNSLGCLPSIGSIGVPSATAGFGFIVKGSNVRNNKNGLMFYGVSGPAALPFQSGTLCVKGPIKRTGAVNSGGTAAPVNNCSGVYSLDMNSFALSAGPPLPLAALRVPGTLVYCQFWGRDPGFIAPNNTTLTDALKYTVGN